MDTSSNIDTSNFITIDELSNIYEARLNKETVDGNSLLNILTPSISDLRSKLSIWAGLGFPPTYEIYRYPIELPILCSDGVTRQLMPYVDFCLKASLTDKIAQLQISLVGIHVDLVISDPNILIIAVTKLS